MVAPSPSVAPLDGVVVAFDEARGWGIVEAAGGRYWFHCTQLLDGTRTVQVGARVRFDIAPGHLGRWEAVRISSVEGATSSPAQAIETQP